MIHHVPSTIRLVTSLAAILLATACIHDWDSLEAPEGEGGGGGSGTGTPATCPGEEATVEALCTVYCDQINDCVVSDPNCMSDCEAAMGDCSPGDLGKIRSCMNAIDTCTCDAICGVASTLDLGLAVCVGGTISCWSPPHSCP